MKSIAVLFALTLCTLFAPSKAHAQSSHEPIVIILCDDCGGDPWPSCKNSPHGDCTNTQVEIPTFNPPADPILDGPIMFDPSLCDNGPIFDSRQAAFVATQCGGRRPNWPQNFLP